MILHRVHGRVDRDVVRACVRAGAARSSVPESCSTPSLTVINQLSLLFGNKMSKILSGP